MNGWERRGVRIRVVTAGLILFGLGWLSVRPLRPLPPLGPFLDPVHGVWSTARTAALPARAADSLPGLEQPARVIYDRRGVPHIFAASVEDVTRALGYVVARERLFQLDIQARATDGTLTEVAGGLALEADRRVRRLGLAESAYRNFEALDPDSREHRLLEAYAEGVNAWLAQLGPRDLPFEYHLLGARPRAWEPEYSLLLLKQMSLTLAFSGLERRRLAAAARVGRPAADALFPRVASIQQPVEPTGNPAPRLVELELPPPGSPDSSARQLFAALSDVTPGRGRLAGMGAGTEDALGSNNWAVGPVRSAGGHALLAGDPHLDMTLPSLWYEVHLVVPDELDVYGVTIPGAPGVIIGFNRHVAWSFTNTGADVLDYYREQVDDDVSPERYRLDGAWEPLRRRVETYRGPSGRVLAVDTIHHTHRGPMRRQGDAWWSMRWTVLEDQGEYEAFRRIAFATTVDAWLEAMEGYVAPAQNGLVADRNGSIAIRASGRYPIRPGNGRGDIVRDGSTRSSDWIGYWPVSRYPFAVDPGQGYLASANQQPIDPRADDGYLGAAWPPPWRAIHINRLLREHDAVTADDFRRWQTDPGSARADWFVPAFLEAAVRRLADSADDDLARGAGLLADWDRRYTRANERAVLFEAAMDHLAFAVWDELRSEGDDLPFVRPGSTLLAALLRDSTSIWWDDRNTEPRERRDDILAASLAAAYREAVRDHGPPDEGGWRWSEHRVANLFHLLRIGALSRTGLSVRGGPSTLSPSSGLGTHGASWRMVVELGDSVRAWTVYPGGQSGHPASPRYADRLPTWLAGELEEAIVPGRREDLAPEDRLAELRLEVR